MDKSLKVTTFNCHGLKSSTTYLKDLCEKNDILFLQETWLTEDELVLLKQIHSDFNGFGISAMDSSSCILTVRPHGGVGILYRNNLGKLCNEVKYNENRILGLEFDSMSHGKILFLNVYLPYQYADNHEEYDYCLGFIQSVIQTSDKSNTFVQGDLNAAVNSHFENELLSMCNNSSLIVCDYEKFNRNSGMYTYVSHSHNTTSWLDHIISSKIMYDVISKIYVSVKSPCSDHLALSACLNIDYYIASSVKYQSSGQIKSHSVTNWSKADPVNLSNYKDCTSRLLGNIVLPDSIKICSNINCDIESHKCDIDNLCNNICTANP